MLLIGRKVYQRGRLLWDKTEFAGMWLCGGMSGKGGWSPTWKHDLRSPVVPVSHSIFLCWFTFLTCFYASELKSVLQMYMENWNSEQALEPRVTASQFAIISPLRMLSPATVENIIYSELACVMKPQPVRHINIHCTEKQMWAKFLDNSLEIS